MSKVDSKSNSAGRSARSTGSAGRSQGKGSAAKSTSKSANRVAQKSQSDSARVKEVKDGFKKSSELNSLEKGMQEEKPAVNFDAWGLGDSARTDVEHELHIADSGHTFGDIVPSSNSGVQHDIHLNDNGHTFGDILPSSNSGVQHDIHLNNNGHTFGDILPQNFRFGDIVVPPGSGL